MRPMILVLALGLAGPALLPNALVSSAAAAEVFADAGLVEILPAGDLIAGSPATINAIALSPDGSPMTGLKLKLTSSNGTATGWKEVGGGLYQFAFTPTSDGEATISGKGKSPAKLSVAPTVTLSVRPAAGKTVTATANPQSIVLGQTDSATLSLGVDGPATSLLVETNSGNVSDLTPMGPGRFTARFSTPKVNYPHLSIVTIAESTHPEKLYGAAVVPLNGSVSYPVSAAPNATVILKIGDREFGPVKADASGKAKVPVVVTPGVSQATQVTVIDGVSSEQVIDLKVPETKRLKLFPTRDTLPGDPRLSVPVRVLVLQPDGSPDTGASVNFTATAGEVGDATHEGNGIYVAAYKPAAVGAKQEVTLQAQVSGSRVQIDERTLTLLPPRPTFLSLSAEPETLPAGATALKVFASVVDANGEGLSKRNLKFFARGATVKGITDMNGGDYKAEFSANGKGSAEVFATVLTPVSSSPVAQVLVIPGTGSLPNNGVSNTPVLIVTTDAHGQPVANVDVTLALDGDGSLPTTAKTNEHGIANVVYTAGTSASLARIAASTGTIRGAGSLIQSSLSFPRLPAAGSEDYVALTTSWSEVVARLSVAREGAAAEVAALAAATDPRGETAPTGTSNAEIATLEVALVEASATPGSAVTITATATDANGLGVPGRDLDFLTNGAAVGAVEDTGSGTYRAQLTIPGDASGEVKVSVAAPSGVMKLLRIPISDAVAASDTPPGPTWGSTESSAQTWGANGNDAASATAPEASSEPAPVAATKTEKVPRPQAENDGPWLRIRASGVGSTYQYNQSPSSDPGPLLTEQLGVGAAYGGKNAAPFGGELQARGWIPSLPYVGFNVLARSTSYGIAANVFSDTANDWLYDIQVDATGRYFFDMNGDRYWLGAKAGFRYTDFIIFTGCLEPSCQVEYGPLGLPGLEAGVELGAEIGDFYLVSGATEGFANGSVPYATSVDANIGYQIIDNAFVDIGFTGQWRTLVLEGKDSGLERGTVTDNQLLFKVGAGFSM